MDFGLGVGLQFPPAAIVALLNSIPCCNLHFTPFTLNLGFGIPLTPYITAINALIKSAYVAMQTEAATLGIPSAINIPQCKI
jgi:hypothetical protein